MPDIYLGMFPATQGNSAFHPFGVGKWGQASAGKEEAGMVHSFSGCMQGVQVNLCVRSLENIWFVEVWYQGCCCGVVCVQEQSQIIWKYRDSLQREVSLDALRALLEYNKQEVRSGESKVRTHIDTYLSHVALPAHVPVAVVTHFHSYLHRRFEFWCAQVQRPHLRA